MKKCKICGTEKTWSGDDINCPFQNSDIFGKNWNCGVINQIRDICDKAMDGKDSNLHYQYCDDQKYAVINIDVIDEINGLCLWVSWYKDRGGTDAMWILDHLYLPRIPTLTELQHIIKYYFK